MHSPDTVLLHTRHLSWHWCRESRLGRARPDEHRNGSRQVCRSARTACPHQLQHMKDTGIIAQSMFVFVFLCLAVRSPAWLWVVFCASACRGEDPAGRWTSFHVARKPRQGHVTLDCQTAPEWLAISPAAHIYKCTHCAAPSQEIHTQKRGVNISLRKVWFMRGTQQEHIAVRLVLGQRQQNGRIREWEHGFKVKEEIKVLQHRENGQRNRWAENTDNLTGEWGGEQAKRKKGRQVCLCGEIQRAGLNKKVQRLRKYSLSFYKTRQNTSAKMHPQNLSAIVWQWLSFLLAVSSC